MVDFVIVVVSLVVGTWTTLVDGPGPGRPGPEITVGSRRSPLSRTGVPSPLVRVIPDYLSCKRTHLACRCVPGHRPLVAATRSDQMVDRAVSARGWAGRARVRWAAPGGVSGRSSDPRTVASW